MGRGNPMTSIKGIGAAAGVIVLLVAGFAALLLAVGDPEVMGRVNAWWVIASFGALLAVALGGGYAVTRKRATNSAPAVSAQNVAVQALRVLLVVSGVLGLLFVLGLVVG
jgi:hypothetical protein